MGLNIKNERVHALARQAAAVTGKSQTSAIEEALLMLLASYDADPQRQRAAAKVDLVRSIAAEYGADPGRADRSIRNPEDLYDDAGLPR